MHIVLTPILLGFSKDVFFNVFGSFLKFILSFSLQSVLQNLLNYFMNFCKIKILIKIDLSRGKDSVVYYELIETQTLILLEWVDLFSV